MYLKFGEIAVIFQLRAAPTVILQRTVDYSRYVHTSIVLIFFRMDRPLGGTIRLSIRTLLVCVSVTFLLVGAVTETCKNGATDYVARYECSQYFLNHEIDFFSQRNWRKGGGHANEL